jgi:hypothetical protein
MNLINKLRKLWFEFPMWRRDYLISYAANFGDLDILGRRLYQTPTDIGNVLEVFFGNTIARTVENMIREQIIIGLEILRAEKTGDVNSINENTRTLYQNVEQMSEYLAQINPYWDKETWNRLLHDYYETSILEMVLVLAGKYEEAVKLYDSMENLALSIADYMAGGMIPYFTGLSEASTPPLR